VICGTLFLEPHLAYGDAAQQPVPVAAPQRVNVLVHVNVPDTGFKGAEVIAWKG